MRNNAALTYGIMVLAGILLFVPFLGHVHLFDWDEINFAECAREMIVSKDYLRVQIDFQPFWEKPPLFIWMQVLSMKAFGINEFAARFPNALAGIATLCTLYYAGKRVSGELLGRWWPVIYVATWLPHFYFKSGIIDPVFNLFIFSAFFQNYLIIHGKRKLLHAALAGLFIGLAVLTKGPVAIAVAGISLVVYMILQRGMGGYTFRQLLVLAACTLAVTASWFGVEVASHGWALVKEFIDYQAGLFSQNIADHAEPWYYHPIVLLIGCFPASLFLFQYRRHNPSGIPQTRAFTQWMWILFWVVLILFSIVKTKIVHYSSLCYYPITYLAALQVVRLWGEKDKLRKWLPAAQMVLGICWAALVGLLPLVGLNKTKLVPYIKDPFAVANLAAPVSWHWAECLFGLLYLAGIIWCFLRIRNHFRQSILVLTVLQVLMIQVTITHFTPKIEGYSQRAAITFFEAQKGKDVYIHPLGYKSYAHLFYAAKQPTLNPDYYGHDTTYTKGGEMLLTFRQNEAWLLYGAVDKPAYFICKINDAPKYQGIPTIEETGAANGFVFFRRK